MNASNFDPRRWRLLIVSVMINTCVGFCYTWSVIQGELIKTYGWNLKEVSLAFTILMAVSSFLQILGGKAMERFPCRRVVMLGGLLMGIGGFVLGESGTLGSLYVGASVFGIGTALVYPCTVSNTGKFFPDRPGFVAGLLAAGMGSGAVIWSPLISLAMDHFSVGSTLKLCGLIFLILVCIPAIFIIDAANISPVRKTAVAYSCDKNWKQMLRDRRFWLIAALLVLGGSSGMMVMGHSSTVAQESLGFTMVQASAVVSVLAAFNTVGRVFWGTLSDKFGRPAILAVLFVTLAGAMMILAAPVSSWIFLIALLLVGCAYGGLMGMISSLTSDAFGLKNLGVNFGIMFVTVGISSIAGPVTAATIMTTTGSFSAAFLLAGILSIAGFGLAFLFTRMQARQIKKQRKIAG